MATRRLARPSILAYRAELDQLLADLRAFSQVDKNQQLWHLQAHLATLDHIMTGDKLKERRERVLEAHQLFLTMNQDEQLHYVEQLCDHARSRQGHHFRQGLFLAPFVAQYIRTVRSGLYKQRKHGNWFEWRQNHRDNTEINLEPGNAGDQSVREHMREYQQYGQLPLPS
ncbi:uncharacterized protein F4812DRAFT_470976 [Daldinia caldariorum]|uniref:uncharacterized protein n=1 Tax=Daldinia caldariorum TaxID=326644 RepID=UPI0020089AFA|nr:uncharacterized protein F4812DRAFT_470976 [Daldinia caldariorum]KAI1468380.1 hypothetical protein F4812DRAFT_470976 [Daldinia caldariorum]